jgi:hypothetical protein
VNVEEENSIDDVGVEAWNIPLGTRRHRRKIIFKWVFNK